MSIRKKPGRKELVDRIKTIARLPGNSKTINFTFNQLEQLTLWMENVDRILTKVGRVLDNEGAPNETKKD